MPGRLKPLFLNDLKDDFTAGFDNINKLSKLLDRLSRIKVFDPACGSGNFLVIAYKELRKLEHAILERMADLRGRHQGQMLGSNINIENFYGIELDDFAAEVAILSLWIAKHQMNTEFFDKFGIDLPLIPLRETGRIIHGNACREDWGKVCPNKGNDEIYLISNPPYAGSSMQSATQKEDFKFVLGNSYAKKLDYIAIWFIKGARYIAQTRAELAFVTTNSVAQGEHVGLMFPMIFEQGLEIGFAYTSFKWENNATRNAGVIVAVINLRNPRTGQKHIYTDDIRIDAANINGYLSDAPSVFLYRRSKVLSPTLPRMMYGSKPSDGGHLVLDENERNDLLEASPSAVEFVKRYVGSAEYINGSSRWCLVIPDDRIAHANSIEAIARRLERVADYRAQSTEKSTREAAKYPHRFYFFSYKPTNSIIVPSVSSVRRDYIPIGYLDPDTVISNLAYAVYDAEPWTFALLTSQMHMVWTRAVGGRMKMDYRYSNLIVYNNFPVPSLAPGHREQLAEVALRVLDVREYHSERTLAQLYDPDLMPDDLRLAHQDLDDVVDTIYRKRGFDSDEDRLSYLFGMYEQMVNVEAKK